MIEISSDKYVQKLAFTAFQALFEHAQRKIKLRSLLSAFTHSHNKLLEQRVLYSLKVFKVMNKIETQEHSQAVKLHSATVLSKAIESLKEWTHQRSGSSRKFKYIKQKREHKLEKHHWYKMLVLYNKIK